MKIRFLPKTNLGKWSVGLIVGFFVLFSVFALFIISGERGGEKYFSNLKLAIPGTLAAVSAIASFFIGVISVFKNKERALLVFLSSILGFLILLWFLAEVLFPH